jgi:hypothetical protein
MDLSVNEAASKGDTQPEVIPPPASTDTDVIIPGPSVVGVIRVCLSSLPWLELDVHWRSVGLDGRYEAVGGSLTVNWWKVDTDDDDSALGGFSDMWVHICFYCGVFGHSDCRQNLGILKVREDSWWAINVGIGARRSLLIQASLTSSMIQMGEDIIAIAKEVNSPSPTRQFI